MDIRVMGTLKKYRNEVTEWYSLLVRQYNKDFFVNIYFKKGEAIPAQNHKLNIKCRGKLFSDKKTFVTRLSLYDAEVIEDLGIDDFEIYNEQEKITGFVGDSQNFEPINNLESEDVPW